VSNREQKNKTLSPDDLTHTTSKGNVELTEEELSKASGGEFLNVNPKAHLKET
jgi:hypothetical protein